MPRIPDTSIGRIIRQSRRKAISVGATEVMVSLDEVHGSYERLHAAATTSPLLREIVRACMDEVAQLIEVMVERTAILRGAPTVEVRDAITKPANDRASTVGAEPPDVEDVLDRLLSLKGQLRWLIEKTRGDPPTQLLYTNVLGAVERQHWQLQQAI